jgi:hypothetical protein
VRADPDARVPSPEDEPKPPLTADHDAEH